VDNGVEVDEWPVSKALEYEPILNPRISRAFQVADASLDSFDLLHLLARAVRDAGGQVFLHHRVTSLEMTGGRVTAALVTDTHSGDARTIGAELLINAAGPWSGAIASLAGIHLPIALSKGSMIAMTSRLVHTVVNRCRFPQDGDIIVPVGTVAVLGTTDFEVDDPADHSIQDWEVDRILAEGEVLIPSLSDHRPLRAWAGVRALYRPERAPQDTSRDLPRAHEILDHSAREGIAGFLSVIGGKLTTFRLMAEDALDVACSKMGIATACTTAQTRLGDPPHRFHQLPARLAEAESAGDTRSSIVCECELATRLGLERSLREDHAQSLDDSRRDLRLGMGPCQAAFCGYRAAALSAAIGEGSPPDGGYCSFLKERWRGVRPLAWGKTLSQFELARRISIELLAADDMPDEIP
jgi:glycerol-3-phosphate dehydrogenase